MSSQFCQLCLEAYFQQNDHAVPCSSKAWLLIFKLLILLSSLHSFFSLFAQDILLAASYLFFLLAVFSLFVNPFLTFFSHI